MMLIREHMMYDILNITDPWKIDLFNYSKASRNIDIHLSSNETRIFCPVCGKTANIIGKIAMHWRYLDFFDFKTNMTAYLPIIDQHNSKCRAEYNQSIISNTYALDLLIRIMNGSDITNPLKILLNAEKTTCTLR